jgi:hypothetical protein
MALVPAAGPGGRGDRVQNGGPLVKHPTDAFQRYLSCSTFGVISVRSCGPIAAGRELRQTSGDLIFNFRQTFIS